MHSGLTNRAGVCYLDNRKTAFPADGTLWSTTVQEVSGMLMPTVWAALRNCCAKLSFFVKEELRYEV